MSVGQKHTVTH